MKSKSPKCITSKNNDRRGATRARLKSSRPPCRPTIQFSTNHSSISTLGRMRAIIRSRSEVSHPPRAPPANGRGRYPYPTPARMRWLASLPELTWVAPTPARAVSNTGRKEGNRRTATSHSCSLCAASTPTNSLWVLLGQINMADTSRMTAEQLDSHHAMIRALRAQLGIPPSG